MLAAQLPVLAILLSRLRGRRSVGQCRRVDPLADQTRGPRRAGHACIAGRLGKDQAYRRTSRLRDDRCEIREADPMISLEMMPPLMFGGLGFSLLLGFSGVFSLPAG